MTTVLVVDDKDMMRDSVCATLRRAGFEVVAAADGEAALEAIGKRRPDAVVTDLKMPKMTGTELVARVQEIDDDLPVIVMTAFGTIETAVDAMKKGAFDYVTKPFEGDELIIAIKRGVRHRRLAKENALLRVAAADGARALPTAPSADDAPAGGGPTGLDRIIGDSPAMRRVKDELLPIAESHGTVLVTGESGTGKEVIARAVHDLSPRAAGPFLAVNCAALSESLLESELFGHERGAFTGAERLRKGRFELADGGSLLLDEVSEVAPQIQAKLLRVLQERAFERVGSSLTIGVDVRVIATSNRDLPASAAAGDFRQDLFFRLNVLPVRLPPLRERPGDPALLAVHFVRAVCARDGHEPLTIHPDALDVLNAYGWPGNVRELQNICERAVVLSAARGEHTIGRQLIEPWLGAGAQAHSTPAMPTVAHPAGPWRTAQLNATPISGPVAGPPIAAATSAAPANAAAAFLTEPKVRPLADIEREKIVEALHHFGGHRVKSARALGIGVRTLGLKLKKWKEENLVPPTL